uniref:Movement protein TGBp3 n=1 Tax=Hibiscus chlorotic speck associated virus 1 TaxID=3143942 RepID=A0AAU7L1X0_9VIRU
MYLKELSLIVIVATTVFVVLTIADSRKSNCVIILTGESFKTINCDISEQLGQLVDFLKVHKVLTNKFGSD